MFLAYIAASPYCTELENRNSTVLPRERKTAQIQSERGPAAAPPTAAPAAGCGGRVPAVGVVWGMQLLSAQKIMLLRRGRTHRLNQQGAQELAYRAPHDKWNLVPALEWQPFDA